MFGIDVSVHQAGIDIKATGAQFAIVKATDGTHGNGDERKSALGTRYQEVQDFINHVYYASAQTLAEEVKGGKYGNGDTRKQILGNRYSEVQAVVNGSSARYYTVHSGDTLSGIGVRLGVSWQAIARANGIGSPYTIYPGQRLKY